MKFHLKKIREEKNISLERLAEMAGIARSSIQRIELGTANPTLETMYKIAKTLDVNVWKLVEFE